MVIEGLTPFGYRYGLVFFQRCYDVVRSIMRTQGKRNLLKCVDDIIYTGLPSHINKALMMY